MILVVDFGGQTAHLIVRRLRALGSPAKMIIPEDALEAMKEEKPKGIVLSGGPISVYEQGAPTVDKKIFES
jgi:GMP synthase (glutamine-hydrolysing)